MRTYTAKKNSYITRNESVDALRGVAILMVLLLHAIVMTPGINGHAWLDKMAGNLAHGVQLFFMISGWLITCAYERGLQLGENTWKYLIKRAAKIIPLYVIFLNLNLLLYYVSNIIDSDPNFFRNSVTASDINAQNYLLHIFMLQGFFPKNLHTLLDGSWSIVCEVYFYLLFPFLIYPCTRTSNNALLVLLVSIALSVIFTVSVGKYIKPPDFGYYAFPMQLPCFLIGIYCYRLKQSLDSGSNERQSRLISVATIFVLFSFAGNGTYPLGGYMISCALFAPIIVFSLFESNGVLIRAVRSLGRQSYALFFLHLLLLKALFTFYFSIKQVYFYNALAVNVIVSVGVSWLLSWLIFDRIDRFFVRSAAS